MAMTIEEIKKALANDSSTQTTKAFQTNTQNINVQNGMDTGKISKYANDKNFIEEIKLYGQDAFGEDGLPFEDETDEEYLRRFLVDFTTKEWNSAGGILAINYLRGTDDNQRARFAHLYKAFDDIKSTRQLNPFRTKQADEIGFWEKGGAKSVIFAAASDPINLFSLGFGKLLASKTIGQYTGRKGIMAMLPKSKIAAGALGGASAAGAESVGQDLILQNIKKKANMQEKIDVSQTITAGAFGSVFGGTLGGIAGKYLDTDYYKLRNKNQAEEVAYFDPITGTNGLDISKLDGREFADLIDDLGKNDIPLSKKQAIDKGNEILKSGTSQKSSTEPITKLDLAKRVYSAMKDIIRDSGLTTRTGAQFERLMVKTKDKRTGKIKEEPEQISETIRRFFVELSYKDPEEFVQSEKVIMKILRDNSMTAEDFAYVGRASFSKAGQMLQEASAIARVLDKINRVDPEFSRLAKEMYGKGSSETVESHGVWRKTFQGWDKNRRALMVSKVSTTVRNAYTGTNVVGMQMGSDMIEAALHYGGKSIKSLINGNGSFMAFKTGLVDAARDAFGVIAYLSEQGLSGDAAKLLLRNHNAMKQSLFRTLQESGDADQLWWITKHMNTLNLLQDSFFRRALFMSSVDKQMRRLKSARRGELGIDIQGLKNKKKRKIDESSKTIIGELQGQSTSSKLTMGRSDRLFAHRSTSLMDDWAIPKDILQNGVDDALKGTFAYTPKRNEFGHAFIRGVEHWPFLATSVFPFARFMVNSVAFQLKYSPFNLIQYGWNKQAKGELGKLFNGTASQGDYDKLTKSAAQSVIGGALWKTAYDYRVQNQDTSL